MATSAFKSTTRRAPIGTSSPSTEDSPTSSSSKSHRRSRSLSRFSRPIPAEIEPGVLPTPRRKFVNTVRGSEFPEISLDDLAIEFFSGKDNSSELDDESGTGSGRSGYLPRVKSEISHGTTSSQRRSRSVSRQPNGANSGGPGGASVTNSSQRRGRSVSRHSNGDSYVTAGVASATVSSQRRGRSVSRRNDGTVSNAAGITRAVPNADSRRRRSVSVARYQISDSESDIDHSRSSAGQLKSRSNHDVINGVASFQRPTASSHRRFSRSMSQAPRLRSHDGYSSHSSALTDDDIRDARYDKNVNAKTIRVVYTQEKPEIYKKDLKAARRQEEQRGQNGYKIVREVLPESKSNSNGQKVQYSRKRSNDRNRVSTRLNEEAEKYFEDFISNIEDTDFSSFDGERSDTSSTLIGSTTKPKDNGLLNQNTIPVEMEGINLPWLKWDNNNDGVPPPTTPKTKLWDPSKDLELIQEQSNRSSSSHGSWNPKIASAQSTNTKGSDFKETKNPIFSMDKYSELKRTEELLFDSWRERSVIRSGGLLLCDVITPLKSYLHL